MLVLGNRLSQNKGKGIGWLYRGLELWTGSRRQPGSWFPFFLSLSRAVKSLFLHLNEISTFESFWSTYKKFRAPNLWR